MATPVETLVSLALLARVVENRSFTAAARSLGISKSVVSARVARFEEHLGVRLLDRTTRRVAPTEAGQDVYERATQMLSAADEAVLSVEEVKAAPRGTVRVTAPTTFTEMYLAEPFAEFLARFTHVRLEVVTTNRLVDLVAEGFDLAIRISRLADSSLVGRKLAPDRAVVVAAPAYLARSGTPRTPADLAHHECLRSVHLAASAEWGFRGLGSGHRVHGGGRFVAADASVLREAAAAGLGLAVLPESMVAHDLESGRLVTVLDGHPRRDIGIYAVHPHRRFVPPKVRALVEFLAGRFARPPWRSRPGSAARDRFVASTARSGRAHRGPP
jgi:DNA-binding transcriptional LysR family regulator